MKQIEIKNGLWKLRNETLKPHQKLLMQKITNDLMSI